MIVAKLINSKAIETTWFETQEDIPQAFIDDGFKPLVEDQTDLMISEFERIERTYKETDVSIIETKTIVPDYNAEMQYNKEQLTASDYKITKCYEATLLNMPLPYDITELNNERQGYRDRINLLES